MRAMLLYSEFLPYLKHIINFHAYTNFRKIVNNSKNQPVNAKKFSFLKI